jgi:uncharacterized lipoprotein YehR (DUF1307 family)
MDKRRILVIGTVSIILVILVIILLLSLFRSKEMVCTLKSDQSNSGYILETKYVIKYRGDYVNTVNITETITSDKKEVLEKFAVQFNDQYSYNKKTYGGYNYSVDNTGNKVESNVEIDYTEMNLEKFIKNNEAMKEYTKNNKLTIEGAKKMYEASGAKCK